MLYLLCGRTICLLFRLDPFDTQELGNAARIAGEGRLQVWNGHAEKDMLVLLKQKRGVDLGSWPIEA
jgi:hypothetical protein